MPIVIPKPADRAVARARRWIPLSDFGRRFGLEPDQVDGMVILQELHIVKLGGVRFVALSEIRRWISERASRKSKSRARTESKCP